MGTTEWIICFIGIMTAVVSAIIWIGVHRHQKTAPEPSSNPGLIQPTAASGLPDSVTPGMIDALLGDRADVRDLCFTIIDLAVRGYIMLKPLSSDRDADQSGGIRPSDWVLRRTEKPLNGLDDFETTLVDATGEPGSAVTLTSLLGGTHEAATTGLTQLRAAIARSGWFSEDGQTGPHRSIWSGVGGLVILFGAAAAVVALVAAFGAKPWPGLVGAALMVASGLLLLTLARLRPAVTQSGERIRVQVQRYHDWLDALQAHDVVPESASKLFESNIASAMAFGLGPQFASVVDTAMARHRSWGGRLVITTDWLDVPQAPLERRVKLLSQLVEDTIRLAQRSGMTGTDE